MPRGYRCIILAVVGWLISGAAPPPKEATKQPPETPRQNIERPLQEIAASLKQANKPSEHDNPCDEGDDKRSSDLCAQWKAADAAQSSSLAAWILGALGTLVGGLTLAAAFNAARWAKKAAIETEKGAQAALDAVAVTREANRISEDTAKRQLRAYVYVDEAITPVDDRLITVRIKNFGQTPAKNCRIYATAGFLRPGEFPNIVEPNWHYALGTEDLPPGRQTTITIPMPFGEGVATGDGDGGRKRYAEGEIQLFFWARIEYDDIFGESNVTGVVLHSKMKGDGGYKFSTCFSGNEAT